ncbi:hypothetical protein DUNSADRAFT_4657 [Dunaliella salina]|uniref:Uncharacterized protein n=1 Tax=Dunaliella salina TaxID=3046 RepID=A0ABQ7GRG6_DUNSA|nr:hypothetical protein DUNSADRAFT_4657 [Dunaliella salina]|eukprot:KAF5837202.1 hypothetical protein DUNSADRAFT_4657 [Dunaliella salina]
MLSVHSPHPLQFSPPDLQHSSAPSKACAPSRAQDAWCQLYSLHCSQQLAPPRWQNPHPACRHCSPPSHLLPKLPAHNPPPEQLSPSDWPHTHASSITCAPSLAQAIWWAPAEPKHSQLPAPPRWQNPLVLHRYCSPPSRLLPMHPAHNLHLEQPLPWNQPRFCAPSTACACALAPETQHDVQ